MKIWNWGMFSLHLNTEIAALKKKKKKQKNKTDCLHLWLFLRLCRHSIRLTVGLRSVWNNVLIM